MARLRATVRGIGIFAVGIALAGWAVAHGKNDWPAPAEAKALKNPVAANEKTLAAAKTIYLQKCVNCHGDKGDGKGSEADMYDPHPGDFTDAHMMGEMTDGEIFWKISEGRIPMPSFKKKLTEEERWELVNYLRTFAKPAAPAAPPAKLAPKKHSR